MSEAEGLRPRYVHVIFSEVVQKISKPWVQRVIAKTLSFEKVKRYEISVLLTNNRLIRLLNRRHLGHDRATDVIAFGLEAGLGDLVVSVEMARSAAKELKIPFKEELARYLVHGTLHLLGYDDRLPRQRSRMHGRQERILRRVIG